MTPRLASLQFLPLALAAFSGASVAAPIDTWEPVKSGSVYNIPTAATVRSTITASKWIAYNNGDVYFNGSQVNFTNFYATDTIRPGVPTSIAASGSYDDDWAIVSYTTYMGRPRNPLYQIFITHNGPSTSVFNPQGATGDVLGVSMNPANSDILYLATTTGAFAGSRTTQVFVPKLANDPLQVPSGRGISAVSQSSTTDITVVGTDSGEVWLVNGLKAGAPSWTRIDLVHGVSVMPQAIVSKVDVDSRDHSGKTFVVSFSTRGLNARITRNGGQSWTELPNALFESDIVGSVYNVSFAPVDGATTLYGFSIGHHGYPIGLRSDNNGGAWYHTSRWSGLNLALEYKHTFGGTISNQLAPNFRVRNLGSVDVSLSGKSLEYLFESEGNQDLSYQLDYSPYGSAGVTASFPTYAYTAKKLVLTLPTYGTVSADAVSGEVQGRVWKSDWSNFDQSNDSSYIASASDWTLNPRVRLLVDGNNVWGSFNY